MSDIRTYSELVSAGCALAGLLGSALAFLWVRVESNNRRIQRDLRKCEDRATRSREHRAVMTTVIELFWQEVERVAPSSPVLRRAKKLLDELRHANLPDAEED